ncbi:knotted carbamoyltransferase YgeW [bacterium]|nr:knotted carbamoyltransferase YgeW [bacterium]
MESTLKHQFEQLKRLQTDLYGRDFLLTWQHCQAEIQAALSIAEILKKLHASGKSFRMFDTGLAVSIFRDQSTRTRLSFASAVNALGLGLSEFDESKSQIAHGETVRETANMISFMTEVIGIRDDIFLGQGHAYMKEVGAAVEEGFNEGVLHRRPSVINLQCDKDHPTQTLADLLHLKNHFGSLENLQGKKIAMTWAYSPSYGKPLSVHQGIIGLLTRFGMDVTLAYPEGYHLLPEVIDLAKQNAAASGGQFNVIHDMQEAFHDAVAVYPKSWASFEVMQRRTDLLHKEDQLGLEDLEKECLSENAKHRDWECNESNMGITANGDALYLHCLPADITNVSCSSGEVSRAVFNKHRLNTYLQASNKPFIIAALVLLTRVQNAIDKLEAISDS